VPGVGLSTVGLGGLIPRNGFRESNEAISDVLKVKPPEKQETKRERHEDGRVMKGKSIIDRVPDLVWSLAMAFSGFIAAHAFSTNSAELILATHFRRAAALTTALCLGTVFLLARKRFSAFANVSLWFATFCVGLIRH
jgi:hypothetical protein